MINFCMKSVHSLLGFPTTTSSKDNGTVLLQTPLRSHCRNIPSPADGLGFITFSNDILGSPNVLESSTVKSPPPSLTTTTSATTTTTSVAAASTVKKYFGGIGFLDEVGGGVDGLMSCTESLGFESSDERRVDGRIENLNVDELGFRTTTSTTSRVRSKWKKTTAEKSELKKFPPPLSSFNENGKPNFYLWPVRKEGRLELKKVKIDRQEVFHASRQDGRLRLHLIKDVDFEDHLEEGEEKVEETIFEEEESEEEEEEEKTNGNKWLLPVTNGGGDGFRRCHELANHHHHHNRHHNLHAWNQHCVTIR